jgi:hypothetical protein
MERTSLFSLDIQTIEMLYTDILDAADLDAFSSVTK